MVTTGFWPAILVMSPTALSMIFLSPTASPTPMLRTIFWMRGTCIDGLVAELLHQVLATTLLVVFLQTAPCGSVALRFSRSPHSVDHFAVGLEDPHAAAVVQHA